MFQPAGGMDQIPRALARAIGPERIRLGSVVTQITSAADAVTVAYTGPDGRQRQARRRLLHRRAAAAHDLSANPHQVQEAT